ncbi:MAG: hypothetical protein ABII99_00275, partial [Patescibacteria group bacterium]
MYLLNKIKQKIVKEINKELGKELVQVSDLVYPADLKMGDISLPCFKLAKELGKNPVEAAKLLKNLLDIRCPKTAPPQFAAANWG